MEPRPAWSEPFVSEQVAALAREAHIDRIDRAWAFDGATGRGVTVAIIDSGLEAGHPALAGRVVESVAVALDGQEARIVADEAGDLVGHGTACGGIIVSLAPEVELLSVRVLGPDLKGRGAAFLAALDWITQRGVDAANLSLSSRSEALFGDFHAAVDAACFANVKLVSAANNMPGASYPSLFSSVLSVAAHDRPDPWCWYFNPRPPVEFGAWGVDVPVAWREGGSTHGTGNSFAAPHISGLTALLLSRHRGLTPAEVKAVLAATATDPSGARPAPDTRPARRSGRSRERGRTEA